MGNLSELNCTYGKNFIRNKDLPVMCTYSEIAKYCNKRSQKEGYEGFYNISGNIIKIKEDGNGYRLLNPYEWIYAARGGSKNESFKYIGSDSLGIVAWHYENSGNTPHEVCQLKPNSIGLYDMPGNVYEMLEATSSKGNRLFGGSSYVDAAEYYKGAFSTEDICLFDGEYGIDIRIGIRLALVSQEMKNSNTCIVYNLFDN